MGHERKFIESLGEEERKDYLEFLLWHYKVMDAFWFIRIEEKHGQAEAEDMNARVWGKVGQLGARGIKERFGISEKGLEGFAKALKYFPWAVLVGYELQEVDGDLVLEVPNCPAQEGRLRHGKGEYVCKEMHMNEFSDFAHEIDPDIRVICEFAPPDPHPKDCFCRWRFTMKSE